MHRVAELLIQARRSGRPARVAEAPAEALTVLQAYLVQDAVAAAAGSPGSGVPRHWKSGGATLAEPLTHAALDPAHVQTSPGDCSAAVLPAAFGIEAEIALRLGRDVTAADAAALDDAASADGFVDACAVSIELVASRWDAGFAAPALLRLADAQSHGGLVLGAWQAWRPRDWAAQVCTTQIDDAAPLRWVGTHSLGAPAAVLPQWLRHATARWGTVPAGTVVSTGSWVGVLPARRGVAVRVVFDGIGSADLRL